MAGDAPITVRLREAEAEVKEVREALDRERVRTSILQMRIELLEQSLRALARV